MRKPGGAAAHRLPLYSLRSVLPGRVPRRRPQYASGWRSYKRSVCRSHEEENRLRVLLHDTSARSELLESEARQHRADELELRRSSLQVHATGHVACRMQRARDHGNWFRFVATAFMA